MVMKLGGISEKTTLYIFFLLSKQPPPPTPNRPATSPKMMSFINCAFFSHLVVDFVVSIHSSRDIDDAIEIDARESRAEDRKNGSEHPGIGARLQNLGGGLGGVPIKAASHQQHLCLNLE